MPASARRAELAVKRRTRPRGKANAAVADGGVVRVRPIRLEHTLASGADALAVPAVPVVHMYRRNLELTHQPRYLLLGQSLNEHAGHVARKEIRRACLELLLEDAALEEVFFQQSIPLFVLRKLEAPC